MQPHPLNEEQQVEQWLQSMRPRPPRPTLWRDLEAKLVPNLADAPADEFLALERELGQLRPCQPRPELAARLFAVLEEKVPQADKKIISPTFRSLAPLLKVAAIVLLSLGILSLLMRDRPQEQTLAEKAATPAGQLLPSAQGMVTPVSVSDSPVDLKDLGVVREGTELFRLKRGQGMEIHRFETPDGQFLEVSLPKEEEVLYPVFTH